MSEFHFSPRPNRAGEISWMPWGAAAFERAQREDKPILLAISAVWCHWCHVMDESSYSDPGVIENINRRFVPIRVDNDVRPDINARYNMGGWPTTAFLAPDGTTLTGATYLPPHQLRRALDEIAAFYASHKDEIADRAASLQAPRSSDGEAAGLNDASIAALIDQLERAFDEEYGGFGEAPKFPQPEVQEFLLAEWRLTGDPRLYQMVALTMLGMARGGTYDHVEGGFFRYSTTRDWSVPHFEKMAEDHAGLLRVLAGLVIFSGNREFHPTLVSAMQYVRRVLRDPQTGFFAGSQDADESYYRLPLEQRSELATPYVDRRSYTNWTCALAGAECWAARALDDDALLREALETLDGVAERLVGDDGEIFHLLEPDGAPSVSGLFADHVAYARALLDAHEISGEGRFLQRAVATVDTVLAHYCAPEGAFFDRRPDGNALGRLAIADRPIVDNGLFAETLLRLAGLTENADYRKRAERVLTFFAGGAAAAGSFGATYARALQRYLAPEIAVRIVGSAGESEALREAAFRLPSPFTTIRTLSREEAPSLHLPSEDAAYVCVGRTCGAPVGEASALRAAYDVLTKESQYQHPQTPTAHE